jgi:NAD-dependent deacetylase
MRDKTIAVLTGAGISAESGISTFRDAGGLWEGHRVEDVASPEGWYKNPSLVLDFYNKRRAQLHTVFPNAAHEALVLLEKKFRTCIITQNVDDLHERAGSSQIIHLHGELKKVRSTGDERLVYAWEKDLVEGDVCEKGFQLRPHIIWFGEEVPALHAAAAFVEQADMVIIIGTSMQVYPAAGLTRFAGSECRIFYIDPKPFVNHELQLAKKIEIIAKKATEGVPELVERLLQEA